MAARAIAIDGPSGAGKGTVARAVADALAFRYVDTGAMYRAVAWKARRDRVGMDDEAAVESIAARASFDLNAGRVVIDGHDVTREIRTPDIDDAAAAVARLPRVRKALVARQRALAGQGGVVMEGRDIGTAVLPDAAVKIYLDASPEARAARRAADPAHVLSGAALGEVADALAARDQVDRTRDASPLVQAPDAIAVDTTGIPVDEVIRRVLALVRAGLRDAACGPERGGGGLTPSR